jgi:hypothetical protein
MSLPSWQCHAGRRTVDRTALKRRTALTDAPAASLTSKTIHQTAVGGFRDPTQQGETEAVANPRSHVRGWEFPVSAGFVTAPRRMVSLRALNADSRSVTGETQRGLVARREKHRGFTVERIQWRHVGTQSRAPVANANASPVINRTGCCQI